MAQTPLANTLAAVAAGEEHEVLPQLAPRPPEGYLSLAALARSDAKLAWLMARLPEVWDSDDPRFGAAWLFEKVVEHTVWAFTGSFAIHQRVPLAGPESVWVSFDEDGACSLPVLGDAHFACLPDDPQAGHEHATVLASVEGLRDCLLQQLHDVYLPLARVLARPARRGLRTQLRVVADLAIVGAWWYAREHYGDDVGFRYGEMLGHGGPPLWGRAGFHDFPHRGRLFRHRIRNTCCLFYTRSERRFCFTCPLRSEADRQQRWAEHFDARIAEEGR
ncbi:MAG: (2Fe-2S)-binding protein [Marinobacter sp.]|uniref:(2Fe-2S)-binding protein n=1 Tax=Marinobacter sp. TaxID=50741 RepID=UPI00299DCA71|nr:(2Fe-2S)-binding protein [Marinobacter sp.]MDX1635195.1 (2Fe-2S)-binding protein [Marinobacter sp.]